MYRSTDTEIAKSHELGYHYSTHQHNSIAIPASTTQLCVKQTTSYVKRHTGSKNIRGIAKKDERTATITY